jgi:hypothetical protein
MTIHKTLTSTVTAKACAVVASTFFLRTMPP